MAVDSDRLVERLAAVERRLTDADGDEGIGDIAAMEGRIAELEDRADDLDARVGELESGLQAVRGYVGGVDAVDESIERRADVALAKAEELEARLDDEPDPAVGQASVDGAPDGAPESLLGEEDDRRLVDRLRDAL